LAGSGILLSRKARYFECNFAFPDSFEDRSLPSRSGRAALLSLREISKRLSRGASYGD
jgi:hypothetical protein